MERYKQIVYLHYSDISLFEFDLHQNEIFEMEDFILKISIFLELVGFKKPKYVLINNQLKDFEVDKDLYKFSHNLVFDTIFHYGVTELFFLFNNKRFEKYKNISLLNIKTFNKRAEIFKYIEKHNKSNIR